MKWSFLERGRPARSRRTSRPATLLATGRDARSLRAGRPRSEQQSGEEAFFDELVAAAWTAHERAAARHRARARALRFVEVGGAERTFVRHRRTPKMRIAAFSSTPNPNA